jgi:hypothetical protein
MRSPEKRPDLMYEQKHKRARRTNVVRAGAVKKDA